MFLLSSLSYIELDFARDDQQDIIPCAQSGDGPSDVIDVPQVNMAMGKFCNITFFVLIC